MRPPHGPDQRHYRPWLPARCLTRWPRLQHGRQFRPGRPLRNLNAYSAAGFVNLTLPLYKRFNFTTGVIDTFLNNPPPGFKKNSFQFITGITYALP